MVWPAFDLCGERLIATTCPSLCFGLTPYDKRCDLCKEQAMTDQQKDIDHLVVMLRDEMDQLKQLSETAKDSRAPVTLDQQSVGRLSRMDAMQQQSMELATEERRQYRLAALAAALRRVKSGDYGYCLKCDDKIAAGRLAVDPAVTLCIDCA